MLGDQGFWAQRVKDLGVGPAPLPVRRLSVDELAASMDREGQDHVLVTTYGGVLIGVVLREDLHVDR